MSLCMTFIPEFYNVLFVLFNFLIVLLTSFWRSMARIFHPDNNYGFDTSEMMTMINMAKEGLQDQLNKNDVVRE